MGRRRPYWGGGYNGGRRTTTDRVGSALVGLGGMIYDYSARKDEAAQRQQQDERNFEQQKEYAQYTHDLDKQDDDDKITKALEKKVGYEKAKALSMYINGEVPTPMFTQFMELQEVDEDTLRPFKEAPMDYFDQEWAKKNKVSPKELAEMFNVKPDDIALAMADVMEAKQKK